MHMASFIHRREFGVVVFENICRLKFVVSNIWSLFHLTFLSSVHQHNSLATTPPWQALLLKRSLRSCLVAPHSPCCGGGTAVLHGNRTSLPSPRPAPCFQSRQPQQNATIVLVYDASAFNSGLRYYHNITSSARCRQHHGSAFAKSVHHGTRSQILFETPTNFVTA